jgi:hypothetical protein
VELAHLVADFARGVELADAHHPQAVSARSKTLYQPGIGPHTESQTVDLVLTEMWGLDSAYEASETGVPYADGDRQRCDLCLGDSPDWEWAIEIKPVRMLGDNGKPNDNLPTHILSPYPSHRSALTDCSKLVSSDLGGRKAILIYGYEYEQFPLAPMIEAFELLASRAVSMSERVSAPFSGLIHPVHQEGEVFAWEIGVL